MQIDDELWAYTLNSLALTYQEWRKPPFNSIAPNPLQSSENRVKSYVSVIADLPSILKEMGLYEKTTVTLGHTVLSIYRSRQSNAPRLEIKLREVAESVTLCVSMEIVGTGPVPDAVWVLSAISRLEDFHQVFRIMMARLVSDDPFGFANIQM